MDRTSPEQFADECTGCLCRPLRLGFGPEAIHLSKGLRWAVGAGDGRSSFSMYTEEELETDLDELRQKLRITKAPEFLREELTH